MVEKVTGTPCQICGSTERYIRLRTGINFDECCRCGVGMWSFSDPDVNSRLGDSAPRSSLLEGTRRIRGLKSSELDVGIGSPFCGRVPVSSVYNRVCEMQES